MSDGVYIVKICGRMEYGTCKNVYQFLCSRVEGPREVGMWRDHVGSLGSIKT